MLPSMGSQRVGQDCVTKQQHLTTGHSVEMSVRVPFFFFNQIYGVSRQPKASEILELTHLISSSRHKSSWDGQLFPSSELAFSTRKYG